jgi:arsenite methyltransferase
MSQQTNDPQSIKLMVEEHYGTAIRAGAGCCSPGASGVNRGTGSGLEIELYGSETLSTLPEGVVTTSFGCGNSLAIAKLQPGEVVLDLGSGGGLEVLLASKQVGAEGFVYGLDMTDAMLEVARANAEKVGATNVEFLKGDIESIPLPDQSVDVIISNCVINLSPDKGQVLSDAFRVLKPGGRFAVSDIVFDGDLDNLPVSEAQVRTALSWAGCFAGALTMQQYRDLLASAGFEQIELTVNHRYSANDLKLQALDKGAELSFLPSTAAIAGAAGDPDGQASLSEAALQALDGMIASSAIMARRGI